MEEKKSGSLEEKNSASINDSVKGADKPKTATKKKSSAASSKKPAAKKASATTKKASDGTTKKGAASGAKKTVAKKAAPKKAPAKKSEKVAQASDDAQFASLPESPTGFEETPLGLDDTEFERIEGDAVAALPRPESLDSLLLDAPEELDTHETPEENASYENFLVDYKRSIEAALAHTRTVEKEDRPEDVVGGDAVIFADAPSKEDAETDTSDDIDLTEAAPHEEDALAHEDEETEQLVIDFGEIPIEEPEAVAELPYENPKQKEAKPGKYDEKYNPEKPRRIDSVFEIVELFIFTLVAVLVITTFFFRHSVVDGGSMQNTLQHGEHLIITDFLYTPKRGDIIVFEDHTVGATSPYVKRIIGIEGDTVRIEEDGSVYVNGTKLQEDYVYDMGSNMPQTVTVKEGELFVMGDHRRVSEDSRSFGTIDEDSVLGKVILRFYPFSKFGTVK